MTAPLDAAVVAALRQERQSGKLALLSQWVDDPQFFCCISGNTVGVAKDPVPTLEIVDRVVCIGANVTVDFSGCWSPTDTLVGTPYTIFWGDGSPDTNGNFPNPRNPAVETATYVGGYAAIGYYNIQLDVIDTIGATSSFRLQVYARDCTQPPNPLPFPVAPPWPGHDPWDSDGAIIPADTRIYYTYNFSAVNPNWTEVSGALVATDIRDVMLRLESDGNEYIYVVGYDRIYVHPIPPEAGAWTALVDANQMAAAAGVDTATHTCYCQRLAMAIERDGWQWCSWVGQRKFPNAVDYYVGVAHTRDGWATIEHSSIVETIVWDALKTQALLIWGIDIVQGVDGATIFAAVGKAEEIAVDEETVLYRSTNYGITWSEVDSLTDYCIWPDVWVPYNGNGQGDVVYWANPWRMRKSSSAGSSWGNDIVMSPTPGTSNIVRLCGPLDSLIVVTALVQDEMYESHDGLHLDINPPLPGGTGTGLLCRVRDVDRFADEILWAGGVGAVSYIKNNDGGVNVAKEGTWVDPYPQDVAKPELREYSDV